MASAAEPIACVADVWVGVCLSDADEPVLLRDNIGMIGWVLHF